MIWQMHETASSTRRLATPCWSATDSGPIFHVTTTVTEVCTHLHISAVTRGWSDSVSCPSIVASKVIIIGGGLQVH